MPDEIPLNLSLVEAYKDTVKHIEENISEAIKVWLDVAKLIITLSISLLLLSVVLIDKIFPLKTAPLQALIALLLGWLLLFATPILGIITQLHISNFCLKMVKKKLPLVKDYMIELSQGKEFVVVLENLNRKYIEELPILWGRLSINSFILSIFCLTMYCIGNIFNITNPLWLLSIVFAVITLGLVNKAIITKVK